jgi:hypothetical protein
MSKGYLIVICFLLIFPVISIAQAEDMDNLIYTPKGTKWNVAARYDIDLNGDNELESVIFMTDAEWTTEYGCYAWDEFHYWQLRIVTNEKTKVLYEEQPLYEWNYYVKVGSFSEPLQLERYNSELPVVLMLKKSYDTLYMYVAYYIDEIDDYKMVLLLEYKDIVSPIINELNIWYPDIAPKMRAGEGINKN